MATPSGKNLKRGVFDVRKSEAKSFFGRLWERIYGVGVVNLRPKLRARRPLLVFGGMAIIVIALVLGARQFLTHAEVTDFFPAVCLGEWDNTGFAQGEPESFGSESVVPDETNSSAYNRARTHSSGIFCGKFVPDDFEPKGEIKNVGLTLVWRVGDLPPHAETSTAQIIPQTSSEAPAASAETVEPASTTGEQAVAPQTDSTGAESAPPAEAPPAGTPQTQEQSQPEPAPAPAATTPTSTTLFMQELKTLFSLLGFNRAIAQETAPPTDSGAAPEPTPPPADTSPPPPTVESPPPASAEESVPAATNIETPTQNQAEPETTQSQDAVSGEAQQEEETIVAPPIEAKLEPLEATSTVTSGLPEATTTAIPEIPVLQLPPAPPSEDFLKLSFSTNGNDWAELGRINPQNWRNFTIPISVKTWDELKNLQIKIEGIETSLAEIPKVYLDGLFAEVHYEVVAPTTAGSENKISGEETASTGTSKEAGSPKSEMKIYDEGAKHKCSVSPFSQSVKAGGEAVYNVSILPSFENSYFELLTGDLPAGVTATFDPERGVGTSTPRLMLKVDEGVTPKSFDAVVVYREVDAKLDAKANFCQLNLIIN